MKKLFLILAILLLVGFGITRTGRFQSWWQDLQKSNLPAAEPLAESIAAPAVNAVANRNEQLVNADVVDPTTLDLPEEKNLAVPFTSQAPHGNWDQDHNEFCEEASVLMVGRYFQRRSIPNADDAEAALQQIKSWEVDNLGYYYDTTAEETAQALRGVYELEVQIIEKPTVDHIKAALANGSLVIAPFSGRDLGNPNYTPPGPLYHMMVIRGYTKDGKFITNDPGTRRGEEYVYDQSKIMEVMHDWVPKTPRTIPANGAPTGTPVILVVSQ